MESEIKQKVYETETRACCYKTVKFYQQNSSNYHTITFYKNKKTGRETVAYSGFRLRYDFITID